MIKVGVSSCFLYPDPKRDIHGPKHLSYIENDMFRYLCRSSVMPVLLPDVDREILHNYLKEMDGFVLQGGADVHPETYGEMPAEGGRWGGDAYRDEYEFTIVDYAIRHHKPVLGVCRGCQLINVYFGGTLFQDIDMDHPEASKHRCREDYDGLYHELEIVSGGILSTIYPPHPEACVNSLHHQSIKDLGKGLHVEALCPEDGIIEAISNKGSGKSLVLGVQWHPEFSYTLEEVVLSPEPLFNYFLEVCKNAEETR